MKNKKYVIIGIILILILIIIIVFLVRILFNTTSATTTKEERQFWNDFLSKSPYIAEIERIFPKQEFFEPTEILKIALATDDVKIEYINEKDISKNLLLTEGEGYKKSKKEINKYLKNLLDIESFDYDMIDTYVEGGAYLIEDEKYIYFTKIKIPEKIYITVNYEEENEEYNAEIYEYTVTDENREKLQEMLETGEISSRIEENNKFIITGQKTEDEIKIIYKYTSNDDKRQIDEFTNSLPGGN